MTDREKLIKLLYVLLIPNGVCANPAEVVADYLLANGVTFATDTNVGSNWKPASEPPKEPMEYIVMIKGGANSTTLLFDGRLWFEEDPEGWRTYYEVTHWMPLPEPPKEE